jgi:histidinol-phosphate aminotransferase
VADIRDLTRTTIDRIVPYSPGKSSAEVMKELGLSEVTKLASNENPLGPSPRAIEAMQQAAPEVLFYPDPQCVELSARLAELLDVHADCIVVGRGSDEIIHMMGLAFVNPGENVVYSDPPFALYPFTARVMDAEEVVVPHKDFRHDLPAMAAAVTDKTKLLFISNPYNPTGTIVTADEVEALMNALPEHVVVGFDEAYFEYADDDSYPDTLRYVREGRDCVVLRTFSKIYALAGLRIGYGIAPPEMARALKQVREPFNVSGMAQVAALASLDDPDQVTRTLANNWVGRDYLYQQFEALGLDYVPTQANFVFVDVGMDSQECFDELMQRGVTVRTGDIFGLPSFIRVTIGTAEQNEKFIAALKQTLA